MKSASLYSVARRVALLSIVALCLSGCGSAVTKENYEKIKDGMSESEVTNILGSPTQSQELLGSKFCQWTDDQKVIHITFLNNKVVGRDFIDLEEASRKAQEFLKDGKANPFGDQKKETTVFKPPTDPFKNNNPNNNPWNMGNDPNKNPNNNPFQPNKNPNTNPFQPNKNPNINPLQPNNQPAADPTKCTKANLERVQNGMTLAEVTAILGPPTTNTALGDVNFLAWKEKGQFFPLVDIHMRGGKVAAKFAGMNLK
jgi:outer membrane protein assembly factor BamE (lipoprotein component of BamABCDE complex)